ncbi:MAG: sigma-70 family RNA polymerase sigma factor [Planctomycetes bacterium]|nr:sigma-70 family RNA polymerase sigma factor [Planctomycetota bacterium]
MARPNGPLDVRSLVDQHYELLYRYAFHLAGSVADAEDLTQETFCTAQAKIGQLRSAEGARAWLCRILRNHYLSSLRKGTAIPLQSLDELAEEPESTDGLIGDIDIERLHRVLGELPESFRTPLILFYFEEFSYRQIADQMRVPLGTVMSRLARAKAYLRSRLRPEPVLSRASPASPGERQ